MILNITGENNTAVGHHALSSGRANSKNTAIGFRAMYHADNRATDGRDTQNTAVGFEALRGSVTAENNTGLENTALGSQSMHLNTSGSYNVATGFQALLNNTTGNRNAANGYQSMVLNTSGGFNTAMGHRALFLNTTGSNNTAVGRSALQNNSTGRENVAIGSRALGTLAVGSSLVGNVAIGFEAGGGMTTGYGNVVIGEQTGNGLTTGFDNVWIGKQIGNSGTHTVNNTIAIGNGTTVPGSNCTNIGNASMTWIGGQVTWQTYSDLSAKTDINEDVPGLDFILKLRPVTFHWDVDAMNEKLGIENPDKSEGYKDIEQIRMSGFLAQEVEAAARSVGYDFSGVDNTGGVYSLSYAQFVMPLVRAVQEQQQQIQTLAPGSTGMLKEELQMLRQEKETLSAKQQLLEDQNKQMQQQLSEMMAMLIALSEQIYNCERKADAFSVTGTMPDSMNEPRLEQNMPNPFTENTLIRYYAPEGFQAASIIVTDLSGTQLLRFTIIEPGFGQVIIGRGSLGPGTYVYSLVLNGRRVDSKRMVLVM